MAQFLNMYAVDLHKPTSPQPLRQMVCAGDNAANRIGAIVTSDGGTVSLGGSCVGKVVRADGTTVQLSGTISGNQAYVVLDQASCAIVGQIQIAVCWVSGSNVTTLVIAYGSVVSTQTGSPVQPSTPIPDLTQLLAEIENMRTATAAANAAAIGALTNFAGAFNETAFYTAGQYVTYTDGKFYRLTADHAANVTWANTSKEAVTTGGELSDLKSVLSQSDELIHKIIGRVYQGNTYFNPYVLSPETNRLSTKIIDMFGYEAVTINMSNDFNVIVEFVAKDFTCYRNSGWQTTYTFNPLGDSRYVILVFKKSDGSRITPNDLFGNIEISFTPIMEVDDKFLYQIRNGQANEVLTETGYISVNGFNYTNTNYKRTKLLRCASGDHLSCVIMGYSDQTCFCVWDKDGELIISVKSTGQYNEIPIDYTFPENAALFALCRLFGSNYDLKFRYTSAENTMLSKLEEMESSIDAVEKLDLGLKETIDLTPLFVAGNYSNGGIYSSATRRSLMIEEREIYEEIIITPLKSDALPLKYFFVKTTGSYGWSSTITQPIHFVFPNDLVDITFSKNPESSLSDEEFIEAVSVIGVCKRKTFNSVYTSLALEKHISPETVRRGIGWWIGDDYDSRGIGSNFDALYPPLPCVAGDTLKWSFGLQTTTVYALVTFDNAGNIVSQIRGLGTNNIIPQEHTFTDNEKFFAMTIPKNNVKLQYLSQYSFADDGVPKFAHNEADSVVDRVNTKLGSINGSPLVFEFMTDQHFSPRVGRDNYIRYGSRMAAEVARRCAVDFILLGGDIASYGDSYTPKTIIEDIGECISDFERATVPVVSIAGNHDSFQNSDDVTPQQMYSSHFKKLDMLGFFDACEKLGTNAYKDFEAQKIRFIFVDTNPHKDLTESLIKSYLENALSTLPSGYTAIIAGHQPMLTTIPTPPFYNQLNFNSIAATYSSKIDFFLFGHSHRDGVYVDPETGITCVATTSALNEGRYDAANRTAKATAFDTFIYDKAESILYGIRYGNGYDRIIKLTGDIVTVAYSLTNATTLNNNTMRLHEGSSFDDFLKGTIGTVTVTMGGTDITSTVYADGKITIPEITGNVVITEV